MLTITNQRLQDLYKLNDIHFNSDLALELVVNSIIEERNKQKIAQYLQLIRKSDII